jgi:DNA helicase HerA-like ATPase
MLEDGKIFLGLGESRGETPQYLDLRSANRHGLIAGATGTGKTVTLRVLAEGFAEAGVPVFAADVKGDLSGFSKPGSDEGKPFLAKRAADIGFTGEYAFSGYPTLYWDLFGERGHPIRATVSEMGPMMLARLLELTDVQEGVLNVAFSVADDEQLMLLDLKDLRAMLNFVADHAKELRATYGNVTGASVGAIQRDFLVLENQGADRFLGEPALDIDDFIRCDFGGRGVINLLAADRLMQAPKLYATFLLWLLSELFEALPEVGDPDKPVMVFFFDEAHLLFDDAPDALIDKVTQVVRLIRSKGVGVYFITQNPADIPDAVLGQLGNRIQHALRAYTPKERRAIKAAAESFRENPGFDTGEAITELGIGEALVSTLGPDGVPSRVERTLIRPPSSRLDPLDDTEHAAMRGHSPLKGKYDETVDRESAYEMLQQRAEEQARREAERETAQESKEKPAQKSRGGDSLWDAAAKSAVRSAGRMVARQLVRGLLGSLLR